jgi:uncharacterized membrane protein
VEKKWVFGPLHFLQELQENGWLLIGFNLGIEWPGYSGYWVVVGGYLGVSFLAVYGKPKNALKKKKI